MKILFFQLKDMPEPERPTSFLESYRVMNQKRSLHFAYRHIENLIKLGRYSEAQKVSLQMTGILGVWNLDAMAQQDSAMKISNPPAPKLSKELQAVR